MNIENYFKSLSDATRIRIMNTLLSYELSVNEIVALMEMGQPRISRHLKILSDGGFLKCRRDGVWAFYSVSDNGPACKFLKSVKYLFNNNKELQKDLDKASQLLEDRKKRTMQFFDTVAPDWDLLKKDILGAFDINRTILEQIAPCDTAVDLGCGTGELLAYIGSNASKVIGVDSSSKMLDQARKRFQKNNNMPDLRLGELEHLPLSDSEANCAVISMVLHHMSAPEAAVAEVYRILQPDGLFIIADLNKHKNETMRKKYGDRWLGFHPDEVENLLTENGFILNNVKTHNIGQSLKINVFTSNKIKEN